MDRQEPVEIELDWVTIEEQARKYDMGDRGFLAKRAKMLEVAFRDGYMQCENDHATVVEHMEILLTHPAGHA